MFIHATQKFDLFKNRGKKFFIKKGIVHNKIVSANCKVLSDFFSSYQTVTQDTHEQNGVKGTNLSPDASAGKVRDISGSCGLDLVTRGHSRISLSIFVSDPPSCGGRRTQADRGGSETWASPNHQL